MNKFRMLCVMLLLRSTTAFCQAPPPEFFDGLKIFTTNEGEAKKDFLMAIMKQPDYFGPYHFLGVIYDDEHRPDSAVYYYKKAILLNQGNINHTKEFSYVHLIGTYTLLHNFKDGFAVAWEGYNLYPDNKQIAAALKELCSWSFYIKYDHLDASYLSTDVKPEYIVNCINVEYLIMRKLKVGDESLVMVSQSLVNESNGSYDVFKCTLSKSKKEIELRFKLNWDMTKFIEGKHAPTDPVMADTKNPIYERAGALIIANAANPNLDMKTEIGKMMQ